MSTVLLAKEVVDYIIRELNKYATDACDIKNYDSYEYYKSNGLLRLIISGKPDTEGFIIVTINPKEISKLDNLYDIDLFIAHIFEIIETEWGDTLREI